MRSSASTPSRSPDGGVRLYLWNAGEDHPKACTGRKLARRRLVVELDPRTRVPSALLLDPHVEIPISAADRDRALHGGLAAVDCSWNQLAQRRRYPSGPVDSIPVTRRRRLPWLLAGNAQHYGRLSELNTAEAFAAALYVLGFPETARSLLEAVSPSGSFFDLNQSLLDSYAAAHDATEIRSAESEYF